MNWKAVIEALEATAQGARLVASNSEGETRQRAMTAEDTASILANALSAGLPVWKTQRHCRRLP